MAVRMIQCRKLKREAQGLDYPPYPGELGVRIWREISKDAWAKWLDIQTRLVNENHLSLADPEARKFLAERMQAFLFDDQDVDAQGYVPPSA
ncbi:oxidative damage protection protein [Castellaniella ginsengisoli]|uniref:Probable Fe(2+)-trafficking protein n=1 Tax=Castellaniella ginsengisoli TaxID=546114 RepID=A0AB39ERW5_9BURK